MRTLCAIRTNKWNADAQRLYAQLSPHFGDDLTVVFHDRPRGLDMPLRPVDINGRWARRSGLYPASDWGWRCGDYFYYRLRESRPDYDFYWLIEPDVFFVGDCKAFFEPFKGVEADALGYDLIPMEPGSMRFVRKMPKMDLWRAIYALTRMSGRAIDHLFERRKVYSADSPSERFFANDEVFSFSHVMAHPDLEVNALEEYAPNWFANGYFDTAPDLLRDILTTGGAAAPAIFHPVHEQDEFKAQVAKRCVGSAKFLGRMAPSFRHLNAQDRADIAAAIAAGFEARLGEMAGEVEEMEAER